MKNLGYILPLVAIALACSACAPAPELKPTSAVPTPAPTPDWSLIASDYPKVDGSTSTLPLHTLVACQIFKVACSWKKPAWSERTIIPDLSKESLDRSNNIRTVTQHSGTNSAYLNLIAGKADLILVARVPSEDEIKAARAKGVEFDVRPFALDAFVFLVNVQNPIVDLKLENVRDIFTGKVKDWTAFGSKGTIKAYQRDRNSGSQELMEALVLKGAPAIRAPDMIMPTMIGAVNAIRDDPFGIGYSVYYYATFMLPDERVKLIGIDGVQPTSDTIARRAYPLTAEVYAVMRKGTPNESTAARLRDWLLTAEGQAAVAASGYVPVK